MKKMDVIKNCALFSGLDETSLKILESVARSGRLNKDEVLFSEGEKADALYILSRGRIKLIKSSSEGKEQLMRKVEANEVFAEAAMFAGDDYPVTAIAEVESELICITKSDFMNIIRSHPEVSLKMMGLMGKLLRHVCKLASDMTLGSVQNRLAEYLLRRSKEEQSDTFALGIRKQELAFQVGTISATLSRNLRKLQDDGIVSVDGNSITINNIKALEKIAGN